MDLKNELDLDFYISMNEDIAQKFEFNYEKIKLHFEQTGKNENRYFSKFQSLLYSQNNWIKYLNKNNDLVKSNINNEKLAFKHYLEHGIKEKRELYPLGIIEKKDISNELKNIEINLLKKTPSLTFIKEYYPLMKDKSKSELVKYVNKNLNNKGFAYSLYHEDLYKNYNWEDYLTHNSDLRNAGINIKNDAFIHYISSGEEEGRVLKKIITESDSKDNTQEKKPQKIDENINNENINNENNSKKIEIKDEEKNEENNQNESLILDIDDTSLIHIHPILSKNNNKDELFQMVKDNINLNDTFIEINKYKHEYINYIHFLYLFDEKYYYLMNSEKYKIENNKESCLNHFLNVGMNNFLPFQKEHYLILINSCWQTYKKQNYLNETFSNHDAFLHFIKNKIYLNKSIPYPKNKYKQELFINSFYNLLYDVIEDNASINYYHFLNNENENKLFPSSFYYYIFEFIDWVSFKKKNKIELSNIECFKLFIQHLNNFSKFKLDFKLNQEMNIPNKKELVESKEFKDFYYKIIQYIHQNKSIIELHKYYSIIFNQSIIQFPQHFQFKKSNIEVDKKYHFNFIIHYINYYDSLVNVLLTLIYQNYRHFKIIILNKNDDKCLKEKIEHFKNTFQFQFIDIIEFNDYNNIQFEKYIDVFDFNIFLDTNYYLTNNFILNQLIDHFNSNQHNLKKITVEKVETNQNKFNGLLMLNSFLLYNNPHLIHNYLYVEKDVVQLNGLLHNNNIEYLSHDFYNYDEQINSIYNIKEPIFIFYSDDEQKKMIQLDSYYYLIKINHSNVVSEFYQTFIEKNIFDYGIFIHLDKINNFKSINFDLIEEFYDKYKLLSLIKDKKNKKIKNITNKSKIIPNLDDYNAFIINKECIQKYLNKK